MKHCLKNLLWWIAMLLMPLLSGCTDLDEVESRLDQVETEIDDLQSVTGLLQKAYAEGKVISGITALPDTEGGYVLTFSDGTTVNLCNGTFTLLEQDDQVHSVTLTLADGQVFTFRMTYIMPTGIAILATQPIRLTKGASASVEFRVNPSNACFNNDVGSEGCAIELDCVGAVSRSSYVTAPTHYKLSRVEQVYDDATGEVKEGQYRAVIEDLGSGEEYDEQVALVLNVVGSDGDKVQISSSALEVKSVSWTEVIPTGLPVVIIHTPDNQDITSKEEWMAGVEMEILEADGTLDYQGTLSMKGRGNSTWGYPKKPYALKLDSKSKILGMKKHKRWCLLANWMDRTMMRNAVAFEISRKTGLDWTPNGVFVELVFNGKHVGNYWLCEQIKVDENRVNVAELDPDATEGDGVTGGYIFELDVNYDEMYKFRSSIYNLPWQFKDPDEVNPQQFAYVQQYVNDMEDALSDNSRFASRDFEEYMDLASFVDWWLVHELSMNGEPGHPKSSYMNKDKNGKIKAGPVWDFDWGTFIPQSQYGYTIKGAIYYGRLFQDAGFKQLVKERWTLLKPNFEKIPQFIDEKKAELEESDKINSVMWPIGGATNGDENLSFEEAVERLKTAYQGKLDWLDSEISSY